MTGHRKHANLLEAYLNEPIEAACMITRPGATARTTIGGLVGEAAGAHIRHREARIDAIAFERNGWLAMGQDAFTVIYRDATGNRPKGEPIARIAYSGVADVALSLGAFTTHADVTLIDGRTLAFESPRRGLHRSNRQVIDLLVERCQARAVDAVR